MNMDLLLCIVGAALLFGLIRLLYQRSQAWKTAVYEESRRQQFQTRRARDSGLSQPPSEPFAHSKVPQVPKLLLPGKGRRPDYYKNWGKEDWSHTIPDIPDIIPNIPAPFPKAPEKSHVIESYFPGPTKKVRPKFD